MLQCAESSYSVTESTAASSAENYSSMQITTKFLKQLVVALAPSVFVLDTMFSVHGFVSYLFQQSVENCVCILNNLTFQLEAECPALFSKMTALAKPVGRRHSQGDAGPIGCFSPQNKSPTVEVRQRMCRGKNGALLVQRYFRLWLGISQIRKCLDNTSSLCTLSAGLLCDWFSNYTTIMAVIN